MMTKSEMRRIACTNPTKIVEENEKLRAQLTEAREFAKYALDHAEDYNNSVKENWMTRHESLEDKARAYLEKYK